MIIAVLALFLVVALWQTVQIGRLAHRAQSVGTELACVTQERARIIGLDDDSEALMPYPAL
jgi:hypothetical protein